MFARVSIIQGSPEGADEGTRIAREQALPAARELDGFEGMLVLVDRSSGRSTAVTFWRSEEALRAGEEAADRIRGDAAAVQGDRIIGVERYEVALDERG